MPSPPPLYHIDCQCWERAFFSHGTNGGGKSREATWTGKCKSG